MFTTDNTTSPPPFEGYTTPSQMIAQMWKRESAETQARYHEHSEPEEGFVSQALRQMNHASRILHADDIKFLNFSNSFPLSVVSGSGSRSIPWREPGATYCDVCFPGMKDLNEFDILQPAPPATPVEPEQGQMLRVELAPPSWDVPMVNFNIESMSVEALDRYLGLWTVNPDLDTLDAHLAQVRAARANLEDMVVDPDILGEGMHSNAFSMMSHDAELIKEIMEALGGDPEPFVAGWD